MYVHYKWNKPIFHQAAIYSCNNCRHSCEVYSNFEWVEPLIDTCSKCNKENVPTRYIPDFLYRSDRYPNLSNDPAILPENKMDCNECCRAAGLNDKFHWTELELTCWQCENGDMAFTEFTEGIKMEEFIEIAIEESKLKAPEIGYTFFENGVEYYGFNANGIHSNGGNAKHSINVSEWEFNFSAT